MTLKRSRAKKRESPRSGRPIRSGLKHFRDSRFWGGVEKQGSERLRKVVAHVMEQALVLAKETTRYFPFFTLHDEVHLRNVLWLMEQFVDEKEWKRIHPVEAALCLMGAYCHDLGMAPPIELLGKLREAGTPEHAKYLGYCARHATIKVQLDRIDQLAASSREKLREHRDMLEGFLLTDFLRANHAEPMFVREALAPFREALQSLGSVEHASEDNGMRCCASIFEYLVLTVVSHNREAGWLRGAIRDLERNGRWWRELHEDRVNLLFPAMLLRLADIADFDASRAPALVFHQLGLDAADSEQARIPGRLVSKLEWLKHRGVSHLTPPSARNGHKLAYHGECEHPQQEHMIREFCSSIAHEIRLVKEVLNVSCESCEDDKQVRRSMRALKVVEP